MLRPRLFVVAFFAGAVSLAALTGADLVTREARLRIDGVWDATVLRGFNPYRADTYSRGALQGSRILLGGLWPRSPTSVGLTLAAKQDRRRLEIRSDGQMLRQVDLTQNATLVWFSTMADAQGLIQIRLYSKDREEVAARLSSIALRQDGAPRVPLRRLLAYLLLGFLATLATGGRASRMTLPLSAGGLAAAVGAAAIVWARLPSLAVLPWLTLLLGVCAAWRLLPDRLFEALMPRRAAAWIVVVLVFRVLLVQHPEFRGGDARFHLANAWLFRDGRVVESRAPGLKRVYYPPALYALMRPLLTDDFERDERLPSLIIAFLESAAPIVLFALMRAAGANRAAAAHAAVAAAVMPEGVLVLIKGVAANVLGAFVGLLLILALVRRASPAIEAGLLCLLLLSHAPAAAITLALLGLWWGRDWIRGRIDPASLMRHGLCLAAAGAVAWLAYYHEASIELSGFDATSAEPAFLSVRWYRLGKILQDLFLKFGLLPLALAVYARASDMGAAALRPLLAAWFVVGLGLAGVAVFTPFPLRFEYFLLPAIAAAAGLGAERWVRAHGRLGPDLVWTAAFFLQVALAAFHLWRHFEIISVILESPRWPFPFRL